MKSYLKIVISTITVLLLVLAVLLCVPIGQQAFAATEVAGGTCGDDLTWVLDSDGKLTITGSGEMKNWSSISYVPWYSYNSEIKTVEITGATTIGNHAFNNCVSMISVTIPNSVTSIGEGAFCDCDSLTGITIPNGVSFIGGAAFCECDSLCGITIPDNLTSIGDCLFDGCTSLKTIVIPVSIISIRDGAFYNCKSLTDVYYGGSESDWENIEIKTSNDYLLNAAIHYTIPGDTNGDGYVNAKDNAVISAAFGGKASDPNSNYDPAADLNNDGFVNAKDRAIVIANFGKRS